MINKFGKGGKKEKKSGVYPLLNVQSGWVSFFIPQEEREKKKRKKKKKKKSLWDDRMSSVVVSIIVMRPTSNCAVPHRLVVLSCYIKIWRG